MVFYCSKIPAVMAHVHGRGQLSELIVFWQEWSASHSEEVSSEAAVMVTRCFLALQSGVDVCK